MLALSVALIGPHFIDWTSYRAEFEREASRVLGREVTVRGDASARLLPFPSVTFTDVEVAGATPGDPAMTVEAFSMDAELAPFMRGELLIFDMRLVRPKARLAIAADGTVDWALRPSTPFDPSQVTLEKLTVTEGQVSIIHATSGRRHELTEVNADISAKSLAGPWRIDGAARLDGMLTQLLITTGTADDSGRMRMRVRAEPERYAFGLEVDGDATLKDGAPSYEGTFKLAARSGDRLRGGEGGTFLMPGPMQGQQADGKGKPAPPAYRVSGGFKIDHAAVTVPTFRFETGPLEDPYMAEGHARIELGTEPSFEIVADGAQLRFDDTAKAADTSALALAERLSALREAMLDLPKPAIPGTINVNLPAIVAGDTTIRDVRLSARPDEGGWALEALHATLPGRSTLEANGLLRTGEEDFGFAGELTLAVNQPSGFAAWLSKDVDESIRRLPNAGFSARVDLTGKRQSFEAMELILGGARFTGSIVDERPEGARPSMRLKLDGGQLDVEGLAAFASLFVSERGNSRLADHDLLFEVKAGPVTVAGVTADSIDTGIRLRDGELEIDRFAVDGLEGASLATTGKLAGIRGEPSGWVDVDVLADDLAPLAALLASRFPGDAALAALSERAAAYPGLLADADFKVKTVLAPGQDDALSVGASGALGGGDFKLDLTSGRLAGDPRQVPFELSVRAQNDQPGVLYALLGLPTLAGLPFDAPAAATAELTMKGTLAEGAETRFVFEAEDLSARFTGTVGAGEERMTAEGEASLKTADIEPWLMTAGQTLPGMGLGMPAELSGQLDLRDGLLVVSSLQGRLADIAMNGDVNAQMRDGVPHLTGAIDIDAVDLALPAETIFGADAFEADGPAWPTAPFSPSARPPFTAELQISTDRLNAGPLSARAASFTGRLDREGIRLSDLSAEMLGGKVSGLLELRNNGGTGLLSAQLTLEGAALDALLPDAGVTGSGDFGVTVTASGKSVEGLVASLGGSGTAALRQLSLPGVKPDALPALLAKADEAGPQINAAQTQGFAARIVSDGRFEADGAELALTIASGVMRAPPMRLERPEAVLTAEPRADLTQRTVGVTGTIEYRAGPDAVAGAEPAVRFSAAGPLDAIVASYDVEPLAQFLTQRALEREQARVEAMQAVLLERQRLRREVRYYAALQDERVRAEEARRAEEERLRQEEQARLQAEEEARRAAEEEARRAAEQAALQEQEARRAADEAARRAAEEAARAQQAPAQPETAPPPAGQAEGLPGVQRAPLALPQPRNDGADAGGSIKPETLTVEGLLRAIDRN